MFQCQECKYVIPNVPDSGVCPVCDSSDSYLNPIGPQRTKKITHGYVEQEFDSAGVWLGSKFVASGDVYYLSADGSVTYEVASYQPFDMLQPKKG